MLFYFGGYIQMKTKILVGFFIILALTSCQRSTRSDYEILIENQIMQRVQENEDVLPYDEDIPIVAFVSKYEGDPFLDQVANSSKGLLENEDIYVLIKSPVSPYESCYSQIKILDELIESRVDGIILIPTNDIELNTTIKKGLEAGIHFVILDTMINLENAEAIGMPYKDMSFVVIDNYKELNQALEKHFSGLNEPYNALVLTGDLNHPNAREREVAAITAISNSKWVTHYGSFDAKWQEDLAYKVIKTEFEKSSSINMIIAGNDRMALGSIVYLKENNLLDKVMIIGFDGTPDGLKAIENGSLALTISQKPEDFAKMSAEIIIKKLKGEKTSLFNYVPTSTIKKED